MISLPGACRLKRHQRLRLHASHDELPATVDDDDVARFKVEQDAVQDVERGGSLRGAKFKHSFEC